MAGAQSPHVPSNWPHDREVRRHRSHTARRRRRVRDTGRLWVDEWRRTRVVRTAKTEEFAMTAYEARVIDLIRPNAQRLWSLTEAEARARLLASDADAVLAIDGSFALVVQDGERVLLEWSL